MTTELQNANWFKLQAIRKQIADGRKRIRTSVLECGGVEGYLLKYHQSSEHTYYRPIILEMLSEEN